MECDIELDFEGQNKIVQMLKSNDFDMKLLAFTILSSSRKPSIHINVIDEKRYGKDFRGNDVVIHNTKPFYIFVRDSAKEFLFDYVNVIELQNVDIIYKLIKY